MTLPVCCPQLIHRSWHFLLAGSAGPIPELAPLPLLPSLLSRANHNPFKNGFCYPTAPNTHTTWCIQMLAELHPGWWILLAFHTWPSSFFPSYGLINSFKKTPSGGSSNFWFNSRHWNLTFFSKCHNKYNFNKLQWHDQFHKNKNNPITVLHYIYWGIFKLQIYGFISQN